MLVRRLVRAYSAHPPTRNAELVQKIRDFIIEEGRNHVPALRIRSLLHGVNYINRLPYKLTSIEEAAGLPVGPPFIRLLAEHLPSRNSETLTISEAEKEALAKELAKYDGLRVQRARQLIVAGLRSKAELVHPKYFNLLPVAIQYNVRFAAHLEKPVTRAQTEALADFVRTILPKCEVISVGSYRRGVATSSSTDTLLVHPDMQHLPFPPAPPSGYLQPLRDETRIQPGKLRDAYLHNTIVPLFEERGIAVVTRHARYWHWTGILRVPQRVTPEPGESDAAEARWEKNEDRLVGVENGYGEFILGRFRVLPPKCRGAAMLYYTGNKPFLRLIAHKAQMMGLYFNHTGLWKWHPDPSEEIIAVSLAASVDSNPLGEDSESDSDSDSDDSSPSPSPKSKSKSSSKSTPSPSPTPTPTPNPPPPPETKKSKKERLKKERPPIRGHISKEKALEKELESGPRAEGFWQLLPSADEESILERLGMEYVVPQRRGLDM